MYLAEYSQLARRAQGTRHRIQRRGVAPGGQRLWTQEEDRLCRLHHGDPAGLRRHRHGRTYPAIRSRCRTLGLAPKRNLCTAAERSRLRKLYPHATREELAAAFPTRTLLQVTALASYYGIRRNRRRYSPTGYPLLDQVRTRCLELNYSMPDLDDLAGTGGYFQKAQWHCQKGMSIAKVARAVSALGGSLCIDWGER